MSDASGYTALTAACLDGRLEMVRWLIEEGGVDVNVNVRRSLCEEGEAPLHAVLFSHFDRDQKIRLLLKHNADANLTTSHGETPL